MVYAIPLDWRDPLEVFAPLAGEEGAHLLHAASPDEAGRQISYVAARPQSRVVLEKDGLYVDDVRRPGDAFQALADLIVQRQCAPGEGFHSGLLGYIAYELGGVLEPSAEYFQASPAAVFGLYNGVLRFDHKTRRLEAAGCDRGAAEAAAALADAARPLQPPSSLPSVKDLQSNFSQEAYKAAVAGVQEDILNGEIFQANLAQTFEAHCPDDLDAFSLYRRLIHISPAPMAAFLQYKDRQILSVSPERFFSVSSEEGVFRVEAAPIKGTRPRGEAPGEDARLAAALVASDKDRAENIMITDLVRNDLARVCELHTIQEDAVCALRSFARVHHLVSRVSGTLRSDKTALDALAASFPCGSITGAPKIRAMQIISAAEKRPRDVYCGAIGYIDDGGAADFNVAIRTMTIKKEAAERRISFAAGGGVTTLSDPQAEYDETLSKAADMFEALGVRPPGETL